MDNDIDNKMEGFEEQITNDMRYSLDDEDVPRRKSFLDFTSQRKTLILGGIGVLLLIVLIALFFRRRRYAFQKGSRILQSKI